MQEPREYKGIEYIRLSELPQDQQIEIRNINSIDLIIKIQMDDELVADCVLFRDYKQWYEAVFTRLKPAPVVEQKQTSKPSVVRRIKHRLLPNT